MTEVRVPVARLERWLANFESSHGPTALAVAGGALSGVGQDGSSFTAGLPFGATYAGPGEMAAFAAAVAVPPRWGVLLVRKGGFAVALLEGERVAASKVGRRHVQGRTKAGGQSQQRFARRRANQARAAYDAAGEHALRVLGERPLPVVTGGDRAAIAAVLAEPRLRANVVDDLAGVAEPRRDVLDAAIADARSARMSVTNAVHD